jgi:predicted AlkP superfamily phosphohydrolase/phosphomutase
VPRVLAICLDGYEETIARRLMADGRLPALRALSELSAQFWLDHGPALRTGLAGEHVATGLSPADAGRWAAVRFDCVTYSVRQEGTALTPFTNALSSRAVVFDPPYFDLTRTPRTRGIVGWGAHDPGVPCTSNPSELLGELNARFGAYPARKWIYGTPWNSPDASKQMGDHLSEAVRVRARVARWLFAERLPDWELALLTVSEAHSALEGLWHGIDPNHPLHRCPSSVAAGEGIRSVYKAIDDLIGELRAALPDAATVVFSMHGMGPNRSDAASMLLLAELLYRRAFRSAYFDRKAVTSVALAGQAVMTESESWDRWVAEGFPPEPQIPGEPLRRRVPRALRARAPGRIAKRVWNRMTHGPRAALSLPIDWMPATRYQRFWQRMPAFALPSFYDGRVRINLRGRERTGIVDPADYRAFRDDLLATLRECRDPLTGESVVQEVEYPVASDPMELGPTEADLIILWRGAPMGLVHSEHGQIGPVPYRRTGGHTGGPGFAFVQSAGLHPGEYGRRSAYDVVPTLFELLGQPPKDRLSGASLMSPKSDGALRALGEP